MSTPVSPASPPLAPTALAAGTAPRRRLLRTAALVALYPLYPLTGPASAQPQQGQAVVWPDVTLLDDTRWGSAQAQGKHVIVVFWSTTCPFCLRHNAHVEKLRRSLAGKPVQILTAARDRDPAVVRSYL
ncbi:MAG: hypothetical protein ACK52R_01485, partial [Betaproteobacteria bacterium]